MSYMIIVGVADGPHRRGVTPLLFHTPVVKKAFKKTIEGKTVEEMTPTNTCFPISSHGELKETSNIHSHQQRQAAATGSAPHGGLRLTRPCWAN